MVDDPQIVIFKLMRYTKQNTLELGALHRSWEVYFIHENICTQSVLIRHVDNESQDITDILRWHLPQK